MAELRYYPYGEVRYRDGNTPTRLRFTGQRWDWEIGLYYYHARYYDPRLGRFVQPDTVVPDPGNPQDLNRYSYVRNSPLNYRDPGGHTLEPGKQIGGVGPLPPLWRRLAGQLVEWWLGEDSIKTFMIRDWFLQLGNHTNGVAEFDADHPVTQLLMHHTGVEQIRAGYVEAGCPATYSKWHSPGRNWLHKAYLEIWPGEGNVALEILFRTPDSERTLLGTLGSYRVDIKRKGDTLYWEVYNPTTWDSLTRVHVPGGENYSISRFPLPNIESISYVPMPPGYAPVIIPVFGDPPIRTVTIIPSNPPSEMLFGGNLNQEYWWTEPVPGGCP